MCHCTPNKGTPWCGAPGCEFPKQINVKEMSSDELFALVDAKQAHRAKKMPTVQDALMQMQEAYGRLKELGWKDVVYCPKDGTVFEVIEVGSTGIHDCIYLGEWPTGSWWIVEPGDMAPSRPILFRLKNKGDTHAQDTQAHSDSAE